MYLYLKSRICSRYNFDHILQNISYEKNNNKNNDDNVL